jgi:hypothetical protein
MELLSTKLDDLIAENLDILIEKIIMAPIDLEPSSNIYMESLFSEELYREILHNLPDDNFYEYINHPDAILADGRRTRKIIDLTPSTLNHLPQGQNKFWSALVPMLSSQELQSAIVNKFYQPIKRIYGHELPEMISVPILYRDFPGYYISVHTDAPYKIATLQFYFAKDKSQLHLGTSFHKPYGGKFVEIKRNIFQPNAAYAFARTETSWHSVAPLSPNESIRDTLALTIYVKGLEFKSGYN